MPKRSTYIPSRKWGEFVTDVAQMNALPDPIRGMTCYVDDDDELYVFDGASWILLPLPTVITDHGALSGLGDDDHTQYHNDARGDARYSLLAHTHGGRDVVRVVTSSADTAASVINVDTTDIYQLTAIANDTTFTATGTPVDGQHLLIRFKDAGVSKNLTWTIIGRSIGVTPPAATTVGKWHYVGLQYNSSDTKWHCIAVGEEA